MGKFKCPDCKSIDTKVYRTVSKPYKISRYHKCNKCNYKFRTIQTYEDYVDILEKIKWYVRNI